MARRIWAWWPPCAAAGAVEPGSHSQHHPQWVVPTQLSPSHMSESQETAFGDENPTPLTIHSSVGKDSWSPAHAPRAV